MTDWTRRQAIAAGLVVAAGTGAPGAVPDLRTQPAIGIQLFMFFEAARRDLDGTLRTIATIGYREVELLAGLADAAAMRRSLDHAAITARSIHVPPIPYFDGMPSLSTDLDGQIAYAKALGLKYITCSGPYVTPARRAAARARDGAAADIGALIDTFSPADWLVHRDFLRGIAPSIRRAGLKLAYHNHAAEFAGAPGQRGFDILIDGTAANDVCFELDCGWVLAAGVDPAAVIDTHGARIRLLHLKDVAARGGAHSRTVALGAGIGNWRAILAAATRQRIVAAYVEQEQPMADVPAVARASLQYLGTLNQGRMQ